MLKETHAHLSPVARMPNVIGGCLAIAVLVASMSAQAQDSATPAVRITVRDSSPVAGALLGRDTSGLVVRPNGRRDTVRVALASIERAEYLRGRHPGGAKALASAVLIGGAIGALFGAFDGEKEGEPCEFGCSRTFNAVVLGTVGAGVGLLFGLPAAFSMREDWQPLEPAGVPMRASIVPTSDGVRLGMRWAF